MAEWFALAAEKIDQWLSRMEQLDLEAFFRARGSRKKRLWQEFLGGIARGVGMAVGFTILGAVLVLLLQQLASRNLPVIGDFLAEIVSIVQNRLQ